MILTILFFCISISGQEKDKKNDSGKVKTGVELEKGNNAPDWETEILKKKQENIQKEKKEELKKERKNGLRKEKKGLKTDQRKGKNERKKQKGK